MTKVKDVLKPYLWIIREHNLKIKIIRIFNTYGPNMAINDGRNCFNFINQALQNKDLTITVGNQTRSFQYIDDLINGMIKMMNTIMIL